MPPTASEATAREGKKPMRGIRCDDELWQAAMVRAKSEGGSLNAKIVQLLEDYVNGSDTGSRLPALVEATAHAWAERLPAELDRVAASISDAMPTDPELIDQASRVAKDRGESLREVLDSALRGYIRPRARR
jgi:hypothetical protein